MGKGKNSMTAEQGVRKRASYTKSEFSGAGKVEIVTNNVIGDGGSYQGSNSGSGKAFSQYPVYSEQMERKVSSLRKSAPKLFDSGAAEIEAQLARLSGPDSMVTVYRATSGDSINHGDWVFLSERQADSWARSTFSKKPKKGYRVIKASVPARMVGYSGKNLEFVMY